MAAQVSSVQRYSKELRSSDRIRRNLNLFLYPVPFISEMAVFPPQKEQDRRMAFDVSANDVVSVSPQGGNAPSVSTGKAELFRRKGSLLSVGSL